MRKDVTKIVYAVASLLLGLLAATQLHAQSGSRNTLPTAPQFTAPPQPMISSSQNFGTAQSASMQNYSSGVPSTGSCPTCSGSSQPNFAATRNFAPQSYLPQQSYSTPIAPAYSQPFSQPIYSPQQYAAPIQSAPVYSAPMYSNRVYTRPVNTQLYYRPQPTRLYRSAPRNYGYRGGSSCSGF